MIKHEKYSSNLIGAYNACAILVKSEFMFENIIYKFKSLRVNFVSDEKYLAKRFIQKLGYVPNFNQPQSFNEKVTARMIFDRDDTHTQLADKLAVRQFVIDKIGENYLVPLLGVYKDCKEIDFDALPDQFVLKCSHDSGSAVVCKNKNNFALDCSKQKLKQHMNMNMYVMKREWHYKNVPAMIIAETYIELYQDASKRYTITTCRVHCFEGQPEFVEIDIEKADSECYSNIYDTQWTLQSFKVDLKNNAPDEIAKPSQFEEMIGLAKKLCFESGYSRIDFLLSQDRVFFSEITLTPNAGRMVIEPKEWDLKLGQYWKNQ